MHSVFIWNKLIANFQSNRNKKKEIITGKIVGKYNFTGKHDIENKRDLIAQSFWKEKKKRKTFFSL